MTDNFTLLINLIHENTVESTMVAYDMCIDKGWCIYSYDINLVWRNIFCETLQSASWSRSKTSHFSFASRLNEIYYSIRSLSVSMDRHTNRIILSNSRSLTASSGGLVSL